MTKLYQNRGYKYAFRKQVESLNIQEVFPKRNIKRQIQEWN